MSKFFIQLLLSIVVGVSAAVSFRADVREGVKETFHQTTDVVAGTVKDVTSHVNLLAATSTEIRTKTSTQDHAQADLSVKENIAVQSANGGTLLHKATPQLSTKGSATVNSQTNANVSTQGAQVQLKDKTDAALNLILDPLK